MSLVPVESIVKRFKEYNLQNLIDFTQAVSKCLPNSTLHYLVFKELELRYSIKKIYLVKEYLVSSKLNTNNYQKTFWRKENHFSMIKLHQVLCSKN